MSIKLTDQQEQYLTSLLQQRKVLYKDDERESTMIASILDQISDEMVVVPFGKDGVMGDSVWCPEFNVPYTPNMTRNELKMAFMKKEYAEMGFEEELKNDINVSSFMVEEGFDDFRGGWVIKKKEYDKIMKLGDDMPCGNDSTVYVVNRTLKTAIRDNAVAVI